MAGSINDDAGVRCKQSAGEYTAASAEPAGYEVCSAESLGVKILPSLASDLAKNEIVTLQCSKYQRRAPLGLAEVREGEMQDGRRRPLQIGPGSVLLGGEPVLR